MKAYGLERTLSYFQGMEQLLSRLPWWAEVKSAANDLFAITQANLSILKTGKAKAVRFSTLDAICKALDCQPGDILEYRND
jgi:DNA-binding Xre family transcriptional regulator